MGIRDRFGGGGEVRRPRGIPPRRPTPFHAFPRLTSHSSQRSDRAPDFAPMKTQRHAAIIRIIRRDTVGSQEQLRELLRAEGFEVTQATLSRDIRELGRVRHVQGFPAGDGGAGAIPPLAPPAVTWSRCKLFVSPSFGGP